MTEFFQVLGELLKMPFNAECLLHHLSQQLHVFLLLLSFGSFCFNENIYDTLWLCLNAFSDTLNTNSLCIPACTQTPSTPLPPDGAESEISSCDCCLQNKSIGGFLRFFVYKKKLKY